MKLIAISSYLAFATLSLYAADPQTSKDTPMPLLSTHTATVFSAPAGGAYGDSPLVRAAKATNRLGKKPSQVITNETLVREGGHFTTTTVEAQALLPSTGNRPPEPSFEQMAADVRKARADAAAVAEQTRKYDEQKRVAAGRAAARAQGDTPEGLYDDPPALESSTIQTVKPVTPQTMQTKPPL